MMQAVVFGPCRGWLYHPHPGTPRRAPVVFFGPVGTDDLCARHSLAVLAHDLSRQGHMVLRFDWPGTGDALGHLTDEGLWAQWVQSGSAAIRFLANVAQDASVAVVAHRLGALVAIDVLQDPSHPVVQHLALLAPVLQGKSLLRELRTLSDPGAAGLSTLGLIWGESIQADLSSRDATQTPPPTGLQSVLLAAAQTSRGLAQWEALWGATVTIQSVPYGDLAAHIGDPLFTTHPAELWERVRQWGLELPLGAPTANIAPPGDTHSSEIATHPSPAGPDAAPLSGPGFVERAVCIPGMEGSAMWGIWSQPAEPAQPNRPVVVVCNTGHNPHTGWGRDWVDLSRNLARAGIDCLRVDLPGWGESLPLANPPRAPLYCDRLQPAYEAVVTHAHGTGQPVVVLGLCSGSYWSFRQARGDSRIRGMVLANILAFDWPQGIRLDERDQPTTRSTEGYKKLAFQAETWKRLFRGQINLRPIAAKFAALAWQHLSLLVRKVVRRLIGAPKQPAAGGTDAWPSDPIERIQEGFACLARRRVPVGVVYSADDEGRDVFALPFGTDAEGFTSLSDLNRFVVVPDADHMLSSPAARSVLLQEVIRVCRLAQQDQPGQ